MLEDAPPQQSFLAWLVSSLGVAYLGLLLFVAAISFVIVTLLVLRGRGPMAGAALVLAVHAPLWLGCFGALQGAIATFRVVAMSGAAPRPSMVAEGVSVLLVAPLFALALMCPIYLVAMLGAVVRAIRDHRTDV